jgi:LPXTG-motif cell wall-anchored protein
LAIILTGLVAFSGNQATASESIPEPISLYKFDETTGATAMVDSVRGASGLGTLYGAPTFEPGQVGNAMCLNGNDQYATAPIVAGGLKEFTISAWAKIDSRQQWSTVVKNWGANQVGNFHLGLDNNNGYWSNYIGTTTSSSSLVSVTSQTLGAAPLNQWQYLVTTVSESARQIKLYVDGELKDSDTFTGTIAQFSTLMSFGIKLADNQTDTDIGWLKGCIDEVAFWNVALTSGQLSAIRNGGGGVLEAMAATQPAATTPPVVAPAPATTTAPASTAPAVALVSTTPAVALATTGANVDWLIVAGLVAAISGSGFLAFSRRKRIW